METSASVDDRCVENMMQDHHGLDLWKEWAAGGRGHARRAISIALLREGSQGTVFSSEGEHGLTGRFDPPSYAAIDLASSSTSPLQSADTKVGFVSPHRTQRPWQGEVAKSENTPAVQLQIPIAIYAPGDISRRWPSKSRL